MGSMLSNIGLRNIFFFFLDLSSQAKETSKNEQDYIKLKSLYIVKEMTNKMKKQLTEGE